MAVRLYANPVQTGDELDGGRHSLNKQGGRLARFFKRLIIARLAQDIALSPNWINAQPGSAANWWTSRWFGNFYLDANGWARHEKLGWVFPMESPTAGLWLWKRDLGWLWTDKEIYPFLYQNTQGGWLYFYGQRKSTLLFYDYEAKRWISKEDRQ